MAQSLTISVEWEGKTYQYSPSLIDIRTAIAIKDYTGLGMRSWERAVDDADPQALQCLLFAIKAQAGERVPIASLEFSPVEFFAEINRAALEAVAAAAAEAREAGELDEDPTGTAVE